MKRILAIVFLTTLAAACTGCNDAPTTPSVAQAVVAPPIQPIGVVTSDEPSISSPMLDFTKTFHETIAPEIVLSVTVITQPWLDDEDIGNSYRYELREGNGSWVDFDCDAVAKKILDHSIVGVVSRQCKVVRGIAAKYAARNQTPSEFADSQGNVWVRKTAS